MNPRLVLLVALAVSTVACADAAPSDVVESPIRYSETVSLPAPRLDGATSLEASIADRRSVRTFGADDVALADVAQLLWAGQGVTDDEGHRAAPSAGARYPIELYAVTADEVGHYLPATHSIERRRDESAHERLADSSFGQDFVGEAPLVIVIAGVVERTAERYGDVAESLVLREAGHVAQNVLLQATSLGHASVPVGGFDPASASEALALPPGEEVLYLIPVG